MSEARFTKGEWVVEDEDDKTIVCVRDGEICDIVVDHRPSSENIANAHLIAAAPEMYEMLEEIMEEHRALQDERACCLHRHKADEIETLLKKARGEI